MPATVNFSGPIFDGRAEAAAAAACADIAREVGGEAKSQVDKMLPQVLQYPTGNYQAHIQTEQRGPSTVAVNDGGRIVYGPWLEGVGSRNFPKTRFKGYGTFRWVGQFVERFASEWAEDVLQKYIRRMN
jgi:hypothetical protein